MAKISVVVPVFNEAGSLAELWSEIDAVAQKNELDLEVIFVDDGSSDESWKVISELAGSEKRVRAVRFRRNFGKAAALRAGIEQSVGDLIVTMDADLQDDPEGIPEMIKKLGDDYDLISGWKKVRHDPIGKTLPSKLFNKMVSWMTGVHLHDHNCGFKIYRREIFEEVKLYGEMHRFVPVLASARGYRVGEMVVNHRARQHGVSKYGWSRLPKGFLDLLTVSFLTGFNQRPQHVLGSIGLASFALGLAGMFCMAVYWVLRMTMFESWTPLHQRPVVIYSLGALIVGVQLLCMGFLAELFIARGMQKKEPYSIRTQIPAEDRPVAGSVSEARENQNETDEDSQSKVV
ncbi:MAG: glycosyltransferase family 2 protein [Planctomycetota bacterium]